MLFWFSMLVYTVAGISFVIWGETRFRARTRLPMQWSGTMEPTWYLPRRWALAIAAVLGGAGFLAVAPIFVPLMAKGHDVGIAGGLGLFFCATGIGAIALYAWLLLRWDAKTPSTD